MFQTTVFHSVMCLVPFEADVETEMEGMVERQRDRTMSGSGHPTTCTDDNESRLCTYVCFHYVMNAFHNLT